MNDYIKYIINGMMCIAGGILAAVFLVSDRWMRDPNVYSEKLGQIVYRFNIGSHWTTLIGDGGCCAVSRGNGRSDGPGKVCPGDNCTDTDSCKPVLMELFCLYEWRLFSTGVRG